MRYKLLLPVGIALFWSLVTTGNALADATEATANRMLAMTHMGKAFKQLSLELRRGNNADMLLVEQNLEVLAGNAELVDALFDVNEIPSMSEASPLIWEQRPAFSAASEALVEAIKLLSVKIEAGDRTGSKNAVRAVNGACSTCHQNFRVHTN